MLLQPFSYQTSTNVTIWETIIFIIVSILCECVNVCVCVAIEIVSDVLRRLNALFDVAN